MTETQTIELPARMGLAQVKPLLEELRTKAEGDLRADASQVTHIGTLCLQALIATARDRKAQGHKFSLHNVGDTCVHQLALFGLSPETVEGGLE